MGFKDRLERMKSLGRAQSLDYSLDREIEIAQLSLMNVTAIKTMANTEGWKMLSSQMQDYVDGLAEKMVILSRDPVGNQEQLLAAYAVATTFKKVLNLVNKTLKTEPHVKERAAELLEPSLSSEDSLY